MLSVRLRDWQTAQKEDTVRKREVFDVSPWEEEGRKREVFDVSPWEEEGQEVQLHMVCAKCIERTI